jgi:hypothetical protein
MCADNPAETSRDRRETAPRTAGLILAAILVSATPAVGQVLITVNEDVNFRLGALAQFQADWLEDPAADDTPQNLFIRRVRVLFGGQVAKNVTFFIETDAPNLGKTVSGNKEISPELIVQDAYGEFAFSNAFAVDFGLMFVPFGRNNIQAVGTLLPIDYGSYTFSISAPTQSLTGRDTGVQAKGYLLENRLEYRLGAFQRRARCGIAPIVSLQRPRAVSARRKCPGSSIRGRISARRRSLPSGRRSTPRTNTSRSTPTRLPISAWPWCADVVADVPASRR